MSLQNHLDDLDQDKIIIRLLKDMNVLYRDVVQYASDANVTEQDIRSRIDVLQLITLQTTECCHFIDYCVQNTGHPPFDFPR